MSTPAKKPKLISISKACNLLSLPGGNPATLFRLCLKGKVEYVLTADERILIVAESVTKYIEERDSQE